MQPLALSESVCTGITEISSTWSNLRGWRELQGRLELSIVSWEIFTTSWLCISPSLILFLTTLELLGEVIYIS